MRCKHTVLGTLRRVADGEFRRSTKSFRTIPVALVLVGTVLLGGCSSLIAPRPPKLLAEEADYQAYSRKQYDSDRIAYENAILAQAPDYVIKATYYRNKMLWSLINDIDQSYYEFRTAFFRNRATISTFSDMAKLGMSAASTVLGGSAVLSAAVTALEGSQLSIEKNFLEQKATESIFTTMDALRSERMAEIETKLMMPPPSYSFEEAYNDALALFSAGSVPSALQRIAAEAGKQKLDAKAKADAATETRVLATLPETTIDMIDLKSKLSKIIQGIESRKDLEAMKKILSERKVPFDANATATDLSSKLRSQLRGARSSEDLERMAEQFKRLGLWKD